MFGFGHSLVVLGSQGGVSDAADGGLAAAALLAEETDGLAIDFTDLSMVIKDTATPANAYSGNVNAKVTYSSPSAKLVMSSGGILVSASTIQTRHDGSGDPLGADFEQGRTNLCLWSSDFTNAVWTKSNVTVTANAETAPDGTLTADLLTATGNALCYQNVTGTAATYTWSIWLRSATGGTLTVPWFANGSGASPNPSTGNFTVTTTWTKHTVNVTCLAAALNIGLGNLGSGWSSGENVYAWGAQFELGNTATSTILTTSATVTRAYDNAFILTSAFPLSATDGTWLIDAYHGNNTFNYAVVFECADGARGNYVTAFGSSGTAAALQVYGGSTQAQYNKTTSLGTRYIGAIATKANDFDGAFDGVGGTPDPSGTYQTTPFTRLQIGGAAASPGFEGNCTIRRLAYFPRKMTLAEIVAMTTP